MRAVRIHRCGGPEVVTLETVARPEPGPGEVLLSVQAAALNHLDLWVRMGTPKPPLPHTLGSDAAGRVVAVGEGVHSPAVGEAVVLNPGLWCGRCERCEAGEQSECERYHIIGEGRSGTFAEFVVVPAVCCHPLPEALDWIEAAAFGLVFLTAYRMLFTRARRQPGEDVLIHGIGGGVATAGLQLAVAAGARAIVTSSSDAKLERARRLGAWQTINYRNEARIETRVKECTGGRGVDVVLDTVGRAQWSASIESLRKGGRLVNCGATTGGDPPAALHRIFWKQIEVLGSTMGSQADMRGALRLAAAGRVRPVIDRVFALEDFAQALARLEAAEQFGKIVLAIGDEAREQARRHDGEG
ncbi:MAG: alcohol dehydrogenase [Planctomycetota bacterium]|nr:MAG: alcohol dehydrogenase [Planctomycetota bacterium]